MRALFAVALAVFAALVAALPSASASPGLHACLPSTQLPSGACVDSTGPASFCATFYARSPPFMACADPISGLAQFVESLGECAEPGIDFCVLAGTGQGACAAVSVGVHGAVACVDDDPLSAAACSTLHVADVGACPTGLLP